MTHILKSPFTSISSITLHRKSCTNTSHYASPFNSITVIISFQISFLFSLSSSMSVFPMAPAYMSSPTAFHELFLLTTIEIELRREASNTMLPSRFSSTKMKRPHKLVALLSVGQQQMNPALCSDTCSTSSRL